MRNYPAAFLSKEWTSADGLTLHYRDYSGGEPGRPPILCIPGLTRNCRDFEAVANAFAGEWRVICVDLRGRGKSDYAKDSATYQPRQYGADILALLDELGLESVVSIGTSLGGIITMAAYELVTGQRIWELSLAGISTPAVVGEWVFTLTDDSRLLAISRSTGGVRWMTQMAHWKNPRKKTGPIFWTGPVLASNRLWIASSEGEVQSVDVMTGQAAPFTELNDSVSLAPVVANNTLYILDDGGRITAWR